MKRVVSVSLGSSKRNKKSQFIFLGQEFELERIGTDGDMKRFAEMFHELDGKVDAMGVGGADIYLVAGERKYTFREIAACVSGVKTPIVDGGGLKHTLERKAINLLQEVVDFPREKALIVSAVDRYGMAQAIDEVCPDVVYGDLMFGVGMPIPLRSYRAVDRLGKILLPVITMLPFKWFYPTGDKQEKRTPKFPKLWAERTFIGGDSLIILRYAPDRLDGKTILTQSVRAKDIEFFRSSGLKRLITTTPVIGGETFATNVMEAALVAYLEKAQPTPEDYQEVLNRIGWRPDVLELNP